MGSSTTGRGAVSLEPGTLLDGRYRVERTLGQGGMGVVIQVHDETLDKRVAMKLLLPRHERHPDASGRFLREARAAARIQSEHVAQVLHVDAIDDEPYIVMELLDGIDLAALLKRDGALPLAYAIGLVVQACQAVAEAHTHGIIHRDLKPSNLFLATRRDGSEIVKVLDFGLSKVLSDDAPDALTRSTAIMGSVFYMSPEQMESTRGVDHRSDIYSLGVTLFELVAGVPPFRAETMPKICALVLTGEPTPLVSIQPTVPKAFADALEKAYRRDRAERYQTVAELVEAIARWGPEGTSGRLRGMPRRVEPVRVSSGDAEVRVATDSEQFADTHAVPTEQPAASVPNTTAAGWSARTLRDRRTPLGLAVAGLALGGVAIAWLASRSSVEPAAPTLPSASAVQPAPAASSAEPPPPPAADSSAAPNSTAARSAAPVGSPSPVARPARPGAGAPRTTPAPARPATDGPPASDRHLR